MKYAIIESGGKQFKAVEGGLIDVDRLPVNAGANIKLEQVLLLADGANVTVGTPTIKGETVWAKALEHVKGPKVETFNYRPKKRIRVKIGHRQNYTRLLIQQIGGSELVVKEEPEAEKPARKEAKAAPAATSSPKGKAEKKEPKAAAKPVSSPKGKAEKKEPKAEKKAASTTSSPKGKAAPKGKATAKPTSSPKGKTEKKTSEKKSE